MPTWEGETQGGLAGKNFGRCAGESPNKKFSTASDNRRFLIFPIRAAVLFWGDSGTEGCWFLMQDNRIQIQPRKEPEPK